jgi:hypothetical protein
MVGWVKRQAAGSGRDPGRRAADPDQAVTL